MLSIKKIKDDDDSYRPADGRGVTFVAVEEDQQLGRGRFILLGDTVSLTEAVWDEPAVLDGIVRAGFFSAMTQGLTRFTLDVGPGALSVLQALDIPIRGELASFFSGRCKSGCNGDCSACGG